MILTIIIHKNIQQNIITSRHLYIQGLFSEHNSEQLNRFSPNRDFGFNKKTSAKKIFLLRGGLFWK